jgi:class 3 adenylate cyclase/predicted ATPase
MQQIAQWLEEIGLPEYSERFAENGIDISVVRHLTEQDLKDIGVLLGHRRKMLVAIGNLTDATVATPSALAMTDLPAVDGAERRHLTVMFCDLVGSTALSAKLDPEDLRTIIGTYHRCCADLVERNGGFIAKYMGDGVLAYFGYPQAHEHDAERSVQAGFALVEAVPKLASAAGSPLAIRVGIATGLVVVGDLIGSGEAKERGIVGETPNLAARLQGIAEPNTVVIADGTRNLLGNLFELKDLGALDLTGVPEPARAWAALRASSVRSRFDALHTGGLTALVGREEESELLLRRWSKAKTGQGQVVLLSGEVGIGKSRLTAALLEGVAAERHTRLRYFCSPHHKDSALYPIISQMERAAGHDDKLPERLDRLDALLAQTSTSPQDAALFAEMLSLSNDGRYPALDLTPVQRRQKTLEALTSQLAGLASRQPVLMILEDVHWADPTSLEAFDRSVDQIKKLRALLVVTFRPEFTPPWVGQSHVTNMTLNRLGERESAAIIARLSGNRKLPADVMAEIVARTDGIPLFVEEMTKAVLEAKDEGVARRTVAAIPSPALAVPASLHASLMARLDRLGRAKEVAQIGAAIGREFSHALLALVVRETDAELQLALDRLIQAGLLFRHGTPPHASYLFKHALVQDAAYGMLLREPRRALHSRIAAALEDQFAETTENQPEILARHCSEAGLIEKAASLWGKAGQRSLARSALAEGAAQLARALAEIVALPPTPTTRREQIMLQVALITALFHTKGFAAPETKEAVEEARLLIEQAEALGEPPDPLLLFSVLYGFWATHYVAFNGDVLRELAVQFLGLAEKQKAVVPLMVGHRLMGATLVFTGNVAEGRAHYDQAIALYDPAEHRPLALRFGQDVGVTILSFRSQALWFLGYPEAAHTDAEHALQAAREIGHAGTLMYALSIAPLTLFLSGDYGQASTLAEKVIALADERGVLFWKALGTINRGCILAMTGSSADAVQTITSGISGWRSTGATVWMPLFLSYLAKAHAALDQFEDAWRCIDGALTAVETTKERWYEADIHRTAGELALLSPQPDATKAEVCFERALAVARKQRAKSWELRAAMSMARLWHKKGKREQARDLLAPVYGWFTEGFQTLDLKEAKALLGELHA